MFEQHLDWIGQRFSFISLDELGAILEQGRTFHKPVAAITFDDGYRDIYHNAFPILKRKGIPAAVFVVTGLVDTPHAPAHDNLYALLSQVQSHWPDLSHNLRRLLHDLGIPPSLILRRRGCGLTPFDATRELLIRLSRFDVSRIVDALKKEVSIPDNIIEDSRTLTWQMLAEMNSFGITIGSHTRSHALLTNESSSKVQEELEQSRLELTTQLKSPINHFSYPDGRYNIDSIQAVASAGYRYAYTTCRHKDTGNPLYTIPRKILWQNSCVDSRGVFSHAIMSCHVAGIFDYFSPCGQGHKLGLQDQKMSVNNELHKTLHRQTRLFACGRSKY